MYRNIPRKIFRAEIPSYNPVSGTPVFKPFVIGEGIWNIIITMEIQSPSEIEVDYMFGISESENIGNCSRGGMFVKSIETIQYSMFLEVSDPTVYYLYHQSKFDGFIATKITLTAN